MAVDVSPLNVLGSSGVLPVTTFSDPFTGRGGNLNPSGKLNWIESVLQLLPINSPYLIGGYNCDNVNGLVASAIGQNNPLGFFPAVIQCGALTTSMVFGKTQFCQAQFTSQLGNTAGAIGVMIDVQGVVNGATGSAYGILFVGGPATRLVKMTGGSSTWVENDLVAPIPGGSYLAGDIFRLSFNTSNNLLTVTKNGTVLTTFTDGSPLTTGLPGFFESSISQTAGVPGQLILKNGVCGLGI